MSPVILLHWPVGSTFTMLWKAGVDTNNTYPETPSKPNQSSIPYMIDYKVAEVTLYNTQACTSILKVAFVL